MDLDQIRALVADDMNAVNDRIRERLQSSVVLINQLGHYIINSGGKRLRPLLVLLSARACGAGDRRHIDLAAIIEFIHTATLLHDDVVDASELRRGRETANALFGNEASVLVGDFLYSRSFEMMVEIGSMRVMEILAHTTNTIAEGEVLQLLNCHDADTPEERYMEVIQSKTAKLFEAAARIGAVLGGQPESVEQAMAAYGMHLGTAFQLIDDVLDYGASAEEMGKNMGDDLAEGKPTLPLIHAMRVGDADQAGLIREAIEQGGRDYADRVLGIIQATGSLDYTRAVAAAEADRAAASLAVLPDTPERQALEFLARFSVTRGF
ncbi:octaprenyl diphosphate synthase [Thioalkalivibrio sulfidiphilus]|uniref:Octaprenyl diphosphate synthase n=1 Tax=Thioalkalivibrio sulfidiphilus (strain HL-EbGR7) TaxID=396588 RepID=B8GQQ0_THISH|nr:octaprenyl diphosphate synthase [Thioalkalivibrio sulfidiphilus]ACL74274.1 octaprenyl-diphosphate synthase [Thioalkalivibrio sulfidiphilus HL-EbGr7]